MHKFEFMGYYLTVNTESLPQLLVMVICLCMFLVVCFGILRGFVRGLIGKKHASENYIHSSLNRPVTVDKWKNSDSPLNVSNPLNASNPLNDPFNEI